MKIFLTNKKAYREYEIEDKIEAGIELLGHEVKSLREGRGNLRGTYIKRSATSLELIGLDIPKYSKTGELFDFNSSRTRRLLLHKEEIKRISQKIEAKGFTAIPLKIYLNNNRFKVLIGIGKGKKHESIKRDLIAKQEKLNTERLIKARNSV